jgi:hypothetical protein
MRRLLDAERSDTRTSYRERLGAIGRLLDARGCHAMVIAEVEGGMLVRASEFVDGDPLPDATLDPRLGVRRRLFPGGYAPFLEVLGDRLDRRRATSVAIVEGTDFVTVGGFAPIPLADGSEIYETLDLLLLPEDISALVARGIVPDAPPASEPVAARVPASAASASAAAPLGTALASFTRLLGLVRPQASRLRG